MNANVSFYLTHAAIRFTLGAGRSFSAYADSTGLHVYRDGAFDETMDPQARREARRMLAA